MKQDHIVEQAHLKAVQMLHAGVTTNPASWSVMDLRVLFGVMARALTTLGEDVDHPKIRRFDILLRNNSAKATRLARLWLDNKLSFDTMVESASQRKHVGL